MGYKTIDWECADCSTVTNHLTWVPDGSERPKSAHFKCPSCEAQTVHESLMGLPAPYMGEKKINVRAYGGKCDTMGHKELLPLPELPGAAEHSAKIRGEMSKLPDTATKGDQAVAFDAACADAPSSADYAAHFRRPEWKEISAKNEQIAKENAQKRKRAAAIERGENVNMRNDKCAGDPNMTA